MSPEPPAHEEKRGPGKKDQRCGKTPQAAEERNNPPVGKEPAAGAFRFDDPYWDDAFDSYHSPALRT